MVPELGHFALILALCMAVVQGVVPLLGAWRGNRLWMLYSQPAALAQLLFVTFSFACLAQAFLADDFTVRYVAANSNSQLPDIYKFSAIWGAHEGSLLLWMLMLAGWGAAVSLRARRLPLEVLARVLGVMGLVCVGFLMFMLFTSNPFERNLLDPPLDGADLNPLLQDPGLIFHPPLLYMGYVGFSVAFAFAVAALLGGRLDAAWARWSRPWTNTAWAFLTGGITLGSYWAYYELGWGGWWFWDPVENASFMPWLVGTALVHSLAVTEKRGAFKSWTVLLAIFAFSLSLLGTFLVRSGVLTSVHAFATDPERGVFILVLLALVIGGSLTLYAARAPQVQSVARFRLVSRETFLLVNNVILFVAAITVLLGTLFPLVVESINGDKISVGPPYFNALFVPLMGLLALFLAVGPFTRWKDTPLALLRRWLSVPLLVAVAAGVAAPFLQDGAFHAGAALAAGLAAWIAAASVALCVRQFGHRERPVRAFFRQGLAFHGMLLGHLGFAMALAGAVLTSVYTVERDVRMEPGDDLEVGGYRFVFQGIEEIQGPNFTADRGRVQIYVGSDLAYELLPEKRFYPVQQSVMTEAAIEAGFFRDLFVALGESLGGDAWAVRVHYKPFVRWIWLGGLLIAMGGLLAVLDRRYRRRAVADEAAPEPQVAA